MPFTFKLSKRLALMKASLVPAAVAVLAACQLQDRRGITGPTGSSLVQVVTTPDTVTLEPSQLLQFRAYGRTDAGDSVGITMTWSATDGAISSGGLYTASPFQGDYQVTATLLQTSASAAAGTGAPQSVPGHSVVHVRSNPPLAQVVVVPRSASVGAGATQQFSAYGRRTNGDSVAVNVTWSAQGGVILPSGLYTAGTTPGGYVVSASAGGVTGVALLAVTDVSVASVAVSPASVTVSVGATRQLSATPKDAAGNVLTGRAVTWASSNPAIATVSATGLVTSVAAGTATITATSEGKSGTASVTVASVPVAAVAVSPTAPNLYVGGAVQLTATPKDASGNPLSDRVVTWTTSNGAVATVSASGLVTGVAVGAVTITATSEGQSGPAAVTVSNVPVASVTVSPTAANLYIGGTVQLTASPKDAAANILTGRAVSWTSSNPGIATVSASGLVTGVAVGAVTITATSEGKSGSAAVTVSLVPVAAVTVSPTAPNLYVGGTVQLTATTKDAAGNVLAGRTVAWVSSNAAVATVSASGLVTGVAVGAATITATSEGQSGPAATTVSTVPVASVVVSPAAANVLVGGTTQLTATPKDAAGNVLTGRPVTWTTSNGAVTTVSATGLVTSVAAGTATITATSEGKSGSAAVTVSLVPVASVAVSPPAPNLYVGGTVQLTATPKDASGNPLSGRVVTWTTSNGAVATVSANGLVTGVAVGAATITATSEGQSGPAAVTVSNIPVASVTVSPTTASVFVGATTQLSATPKDAAGSVLTGRVISWTSSNPAIATVSATGLVTGVAVGSATITATSEGQSGAASATVANIPVASVTVSPTAPNLYVGGAVQLTATPKDAGGTVLSGRVITWASSNTAIATVSATGLVTGVAVGAATITATSEGQSGPAATTVSTVPVASVVVSPAAANVLVGGTTQLTATPKDAAGNILTGRAVTWTNSNPGIAMVSTTGLVTGVAAGAATITATSEGQSASATISVANVPVASVVISPATAVVLVGATLQLTATLKDSAGNVLSARSVTWASSAPAVATASSTGLVTGIAAGAVTITATSEGRSGSAAVTVNPLPVASVSVSPASAGIPLGQWVQLRATPLDANGMPLSGRSITWASSAPAVAAVSMGGLVTGVASGAATITATSEGQSGTAAVTVTAGIPVQPGTVLDLGVASTTASSVTLAFTEVDDGTGQPAQYDIRYAPGALSWGMASSVTQGTCATPVAGTVIGAKRTCAVLGLASATGYQFQLVPFRGTLNVDAVFGALSNVATGTTAVSTAPVASVTVSPATASLPVGLAVQLVATLKDANGNPLTGRVITWATNNALIAGVNGSGLVTGVAAGSGTITATSEGKSGTAAIVVTTSAGANYYVAPAGSDANPCSAAAPCFTMQRVSQLLAPGDIAHFAAGNYSWGTQTVSVSGTASARVTYISDVKWGAKISGSCPIMRNTGDYVDVIGFDMTGTCVNGLLQDGNYGRIIANRVHDLPGTNGYAGILVDCCNYHLTGNQVLGNVVDNIGPFGLSNQIHGIYVAGPNSVIANNIVTRAAAACIHLYHGSTNEIISNNVVANCGRYGIAVSADPAITTADYTTVDNNIVVNVSASVNGQGIYEWPATGSHNVYNNNIVYNNSPNFALLTGTQSGTITLTSAQFSSLFVNYTGDMNGDYHLRSGAVAIDAGTTACAAGVSSCVPLTDFDGVTRPRGAALDIGAYEF